jgi:nucleoside-diphosphate-sugar epimerase
MTPEESPSALSTSRPGDVRVLVVGSSGFLGRSVVRALADEGYEVHGLVRDAAKGERVRDSGGIPFLGDILDATSLRSAAKGCVAAIHLAAHPSRDEDEERVRVEGTEHLAEVAATEGMTRLLVGSGYWVYPGGPDTITEESAVEPRGESQINFDAERAGMRANVPGRLDVMILRPGMVYGDGSWFRTMAFAISRGEYSVVGDGSNRWSFVALPDTARAFVRVLQAGGAGEVYNVVDGVPGSLREFVDFVAGQTGSPRPPSVTLETAVEGMDEVVARHLSADRPASNRKLLGLGWRPRLASYREGIPPVLKEIFPRGAGRGR